MQKKHGMTMSGWFCIFVLVWSLLVKHKFIQTDCYAGLNIVPEWAVKLQDIPAMPCFALMLAFAEPLSAVRIDFASLRYIVSADIHKSSEFRFLILFLLLSLKSYVRFS